MLSVNTIYQVGKQASNKRTAVLEPKRIGVEECISRANRVETLPMIVTVNAKEEVDECRKEIQLTKHTKLVVKVFRGLTGIFYYTAFIESEKFGRDLAEQVHRLVWLKTVKECLVRTDVLEIAAVASWKPGVKLENVELTCYDTFNHVVEAEAYALLPLSIVKNIVEVAEEKLVKIREEVAFRISRLLKNLEKKQDETDIVVEGSEELV